VLRRLACCAYNGDMPDAASPEELVRNLTSIKLEISAKTAELAALVATRDAAIAALGIPDAVTGAPVSRRMTGTNIDRIRCYFAETMNEPASPVLIARSLSRSGNPINRATVTATLYSSWRVFKLVSRGRYRLLMAGERPEPRGPEFRYLMGGDAVAQ